MHSVVQLFILTLKRMFKIILLLTMMGVSTIGLGQEIIFADTITQHHILVNGTNISMIPPESFKQSDNFKGFQNPEDQTSMIMLMEIPGPFSEVGKAFNGKMLKTKGMKLLNKQEIKIASYDGYLIDLTQNVNGLTYSKNILVFGNETFSTMVNGIYLLDSIKLEEKIKASVLTTFVDFNLQAEPRKALDYTIDESVGKMQFKSVIGNGMLLNRDLKTPTESKDKATLITDKSFEKPDIQNKKVFCMSRLKKYPDDYSLIIEQGINEIQLDGLNGYELFAKNNDAENEELYQVILFNDDGGYFLFVGTYLKGSETAVEDIKRIIKTFKRK